MPNAIESIRVKGFRSLADVEINDLPQGATVLIGANGSGKSNLMRLLEMMSWMVDLRRLREYVALHGGADDQLFGGRKTTPGIKAQVDVRTARGRVEYRFALECTTGDQFVFAEEAYRVAKSGKSADLSWERIDDSGYREARVAERTNGSGPGPQAARALVGLFRRCPMYHFHDTSFDSRTKVSWDGADSGRLRGDGANLAPVLSLLEREDKPRFKLICRYIGLAVPVFDRFEIAEEYGKVQLRWRHKDMDKTVGTHMTSDGVLRLFALVTLLNLPPKMLPSVLLLDKPELGLHPVAITLIGAMIDSVAMDRQVNRSHPVAAAGGQLPPRRDRSAGAGERPNDGPQSRRCRVPSVARRILDRRTLAEERAGRPTVIRLARTRNDRTLTMLSPAELVRRIRFGADSTLEFKRVLTAGQKVKSPARNDVADELAAMANARGGLLVLGVDDKTRDVVGVPLDRLEAVQSWLQEVCNDAIEPPITPLITAVELPGSDGSLVAAVCVELERGLFVHRSP